MNIALLCLGTRGDVQPYAVLGRALQERGHKVSLSSAKNFAPLAASYGIPFIPVDADYQSLLDSEEGKRMMKNPIRARKHLKSLIFPMMEQSLGVFYEIAREQDKVLFHVKTMAHQFADEFPGRMIQANVVPAMEPTREFVNPVFSVLPIPSMLNRASFRLSQAGLNMWKTPVRAFREKYGLQKPASKPVMPSIYGISSHFLARPADYPPDTHYTGFWLDRSGTALDPSLQAFIDAGPPPLLITFGSMPFDSRLDFSEVLQRIVRECGTRIVVIRGWGLKHLPALDNHPDIHFADGAAYDQLMPKVRAVVHHGGIGTLASCLTAGKPSWICPVLYPLGDQHFWAMQAVRKGVGLPPVPLKKLDANTMISGINQLLQNKALYDSAETMQALLATEDGLANAAALVEL